MQIHHCGILLYIGDVENNIPQINIPGKHPSLKKSFCKTWKNFFLKGFCWLDFCSCSSVEDHVVGVGEGVNFSPNYFALVLKPEHVIHPCLTFVS